MLRKQRMILALVVSATALPACSRDKPDKQEELTIVVEADRSKLARQEQELKQRFNELQQERERLRREREALLSKRLSGGGGHEQQRLLSQKEREIFERERKMLQRERELEQQRQKLTSQVDNLLGKLARQGGALPASAGNAGTLAQREKSLASREADLARREKELARREADLARREADFLKLKSRLAAMPAVASRVRDRPVSRKSAQRVYQKALTKMKKRGILAADLPLEDSGLLKDLEKALKGGNYTQAQALAERLDALVQATAVDAGFIERKLQRLSQLRAQARLSAAAGKKVSSLFRQATRFYSDGRYARANRQLNKIFAILRK